MIDHLAEPLLDHECLIGALIIDKDEFILEWKRRRKDAMGELFDGAFFVKRRDDNDEYGMLLFSDVAKKVIARDRAPERVNVYEVMAKPVLTVRPDMGIRYCARLFENFGISHAPVVENEQIVGIVSFYLLVLQGLPDLD